MIHIYTSLKEVIDATSKFVSETREADIKRTSPEEILNLFIAANRFGREAIAACYRKIYGNDYDTSTRNDYVAKPIYRNAFGLHYSWSILLSWELFVSSYVRIIEVIAHEIAHDMVRGHGEKFWHEYYRNCQKMGLISLEIPYDEGMYEDKYGVRKYGYGRIKGLDISFETSDHIIVKYDRRCKAMFKHKVFCLGDVEYEIKQEYNNLALEICSLYRMNFNGLPISRHIETSFSEPIEPWLCEPSEGILTPELIKPVTRSTLSV